MKTKKFEKKLSLNKKTVANLSNKEMFGVHGGELPPPSERSLCWYCDKQTDTYCC